MGLSIKSLDSIAKFAENCDIKSERISELKKTSLSNSAKSTELEKDTFTATIGKHKIPRYLYHLTSQSAYESMLKDGKLKIGGESDILKGVFMVELNNFFRHWGKSKDWSDMDLRKMLLLQAHKDSDKFIALKISTANIDKNKLLIRSQNKMMSAPTQGNFSEIVDNWRKTKEIPEGKFKHLFVGDNATNSSLYNKKKKGIEYIYQNEIDMSKVEKVGEAILPEDYMNAPIRNFYSEMFKKPAEKKALAAFKD